MPVGLILLGILLLTLAACKKQTPKPEDIEGTFKLDSCRTLTLADSAGIRIVLQDVTHLTTYVHPHEMRDVRLSLEGGEAIQSCRYYGQAIKAEGIYMYKHPELKIAIDPPANSPYQNTGMLTGTFQDVWRQTAGLYFRKIYPTSHANPAYTNNRIEQRFYFSEER